MGKVHQAVIFVRSKPVEQNDSVSTKGSSIEYQTNPVSFNIDAQDDGQWVKVKEFDTEEAAISYVDTECGL